MLAGNPVRFPLLKLFFWEKNLMCWSFGISSQSKQHMVSPVRNLKKQNHLPLHIQIHTQCVLRVSPSLTLFIKIYLLPFSARCLSILLSWASRFPLLRSSYGTILDHNIQSLCNTILLTTFFNRGQVPCWPASAWTWSRHFQWCRLPPYPGLHQYKVFG